MGIEDSINRRAQESGQTYQTPIVQVLASVEEDIDHTTATRVAGRIRSMTNRLTYATDADYDHSVNTFGVDTLSAIEFEDVETIKMKLEAMLEDEGYTIEAVAVQADIQQSSL